MIIDFRNDLTAGRNLRNNNPCNVKGKGWQGQIGTDSRGLAIFENTLFGIRAAMIDILKDFGVDGQKTIFALINEYAPSTDNNNPNKYSNFIANRLGIGINTPLKFDREQFIRFMIAVKDYELGSQFSGLIGRDQFERALQMLPANRSKFLIGAAAGGALLIFLAMGILFFVKSK